MALPDLDIATATRFASVALNHVTRVYPHKADHVMEGPDDIYIPSAVHPVFHGSFDWHSCVHTHWLLARLRHSVPSLPQASAIAALFDQRFQPEKIAAECSYLERPGSRNFEQPYGWAWLLMLAAELHRDQSPEGRRWSNNLQPLAQAFVDRFHLYLPRLTYPIRGGTHTNTAFALVLAAEYAIAHGDVRLRALLTSRAQAWFAGDADAPAWEPSGDDFLPSTLIEAEAMRRLLPAPSFASWFNSFLPNLRRRHPAVLFTPAIVSDREDGKIGHLDGLNLSRAWCWQSLARTLPVADERRQFMLDAAELHFEAAIHRITGNYMSEHWLASFALLALTS